MGWVRHVAHIMEMRNSCKILLESVEGKNHFGSPRRRRENNVNIYFTKIGWIHLAQDIGVFQAIVNTVVDLQFL
jgi:hypothetical protein